MLLIMSKRISRYELSLIGFDKNPFHTQRYIVIGRATPHERAFRQKTFPTTLEKSLRNCEWIRAVITEVSSRAYEQQFLRHRSVSAIQAPLSVVTHGIDSNETHHRKNHVPISQNESSLTRASPLPSPKHRDGGRRSTY